MKHKHAHKVSFQEAYNHYAQVSKQKKDSNSTNIL